MVILISGATHTGKTLLAQRLLEKYGYPYLSMDHLKMGLMRSGYTKLTPQSPKEELTALLWPVVREMAKTAIENRQNLVVEGCYIPFACRQDFEAEYLPHIKVQWLVFSEAYLERHFEDVLAHESAIEHRIAAPGFTRASLIEESLHDLEMCRQYGLPYVLIDSNYAVDMVL